MAWLRWFVCSVSIAAIALLPSGDALAQTDSYCAKGTIIPHPHDCGKYLECLERDRILLLACQDGTYFNAANGGCTPELPLSCSTRKDTLEPLGPTYLGHTLIEPCKNYRPGFKLAHPDDCSQFFQCTQQGGAALFRCPANLLFHTVMKVCVWPREAICETGANPPPSPLPPPPPPTTPSPGGGGGGGDDDDGADDDDNTVDICEPSCILDFRCPLNCDPIFPAEVFPHPSRCDAYFRCNSYGYSCETECPPGMWFSSTFRRCVYADVANDCVPVMRPICTTPDCAPHPDCPEIDTDPPTKLPSLENANDYYICRDGYACSMTCPPGLEFDPLNRQCDIPPGDTEEPTTEEPTTEEPTTEEPTTEEPTTEEPTTEEPTTEEPTTEEPTTEEPTTEEPTTEEPTTEEPTTEEPTTEEPTTEEPTTEEPTTEEPTTEEPTTEEPTTEEPTTEEPTTEEPTTEEPTTEDPTTTTTEEPTTTTTVGDCPTCPPSNCVPDSRCPLCEKCTPTYFPHEDCDKFYKCNFGLICEMLCPPGLHFNTRENVCDWPWQAGCDGPPVQDNPPGDPTCVPNPSCPANDAYDVFLPHPDCGLYYKCSWGNACLKECPDGLHWSTEKNRCEWPFLAGCDLSIPPNDPSCPTCPCVPCRSNRNACHPSTRCPAQSMTNSTLSFGHEHHCNQFYECLSGQACVLECPAGLEYSGGAGRCDVPSKSMCSLERK